MSATAISLPAEEIHLWLVYFEDDECRSKMTEFRLVLSADERRQSPRFYFENDRIRYLATRALVRHTLSLYLPLTPQAWNFVVNEYGRPAADNPEARSFGLSFNVSHTRSLVVMGVARHRALGVDAENFRARNAPLSLANSCFAPQEVRALGTTPACDRQRRFFEYWTFKEAYIKARGMGLSLPLEKFAFNLEEPNSVTVAIESTIDANPERWMFWQLETEQQYLVAICAETTKAPARLRAWRTIPGWQATVLSPLVTRASH